MKNTKEAIRYGIETLKVSPERMFALIESSEGYDGEDYNRWLASQIIKIADKEGVGFTQLLVKKFAIIQSLIEEYSDDSIKEEWLEYFTSKLKGITEGLHMYTINLSGVGDEIEDVDWFNGIDIDSVNGVFVNEQLPEEVRTAFIEDKVSFLCKLGSDSADKNSDLYKEAKNCGVPCKSEGALMLYRFCSMVAAFEDVTEMRVGFLSSTNFLFDKENAPIIKYFLNYFTVKGIVMSSNELLKDSYTSGEYAFLLCKPRVGDEKVQDGLVLHDVVMQDGKPKSMGTRRFSESSRDMLESIIENAKVGAKSKAPVLSENGEIVYGEASVNSLGYLQYDRYSNLYISNLLALGKNNIVITEENLKDIIIYFAVSKSLEGFGLARNIKEVITGHSSYEELLYNCLPLFLFDIGNVCKDYGKLLVEGGEVQISNAFDIKSELISNMLERGEVFYSFEAKQLLEICKGFLDFLEKEVGSTVKGKTFEEVRAEANHTELNNQYMIALNNLKDYVSTLYRKVM